MSRPSISVLLVDDDQTLARILHRELSETGYEVQTARTGEEAMTKVEANDFDVVLLDIHLPGMNGTDALQVIKKASPLTEVIMLTGHGSIGGAVHSIKLGAYDYLTKPCDLEALEAVIQRAREKKALLQQNEALKQELARRDRFQEFVGRSPKMKQVLEMIDRVAVADRTALIQGESGVGKELVAGAIHRHSPRAGNPFVVVDCSSLHEELLQSELFGHEKGAFTGATSLKHGLFEVADRGTMFLDEIAQLDPVLQAKLLRVLEVGAFRRVGGVRDLRVDVRMIAATNCDLEEMVTQGRFREDLFYRLNVVTLVVPPLRERKEDIPALAAHFIKSCSIPGKKVRGISEEALEILIAYDWPGNVRELKNVLERGVILADQEQLLPQDLPGNLKINLARLTRRGENGTLPSLRDLERHYIEQLLKEFQGNRNKVARALQISERNLYRKIRAYQL